MRSVIKLAKWTKEELIPDVEPTGHDGLFDKHSTTNYFKKVGKLLKLIVTIFKSQSRKHAR